MPPPPRPQPPLSLLASSTPATRLAAVDEAVLAPAEATSSPLTMQVFLRESPRSIFLLAAEGEKNAKGSALLLTTQSSPTSAPRAVVEAVQWQSLPPLDTLHKLHGRAYGCLGLINVGSGEQYRRWRDVQDTNSHTPTP